ncbi:MAG: peptide chain release factor 1 [Clostridiales bacterium]|nr:peptide chain release factor 1 [Clostridiales bacterium]
MEEKLKQAALRLQEVELLLAQPEVYADPVRLRALTREQKELTPVVSAFGELEAARAMQSEAEQMLSDPELRELAREELRQAKERQEALLQELKLLLLPKDPDDDRSVVLELRAGVGGEEGALFAADLLRMYLLYADKCGWQTDVVSRSDTELGGVKEAVLTVEGAGVYARLKFEGGTHCVKRVPETESAGRIHTSTATVAVLPEAEETELYIAPEELRIDTFRAGGAGGQHVNKTESAIRITHLPTGTVVECQDERSQYKNKDRAMKILRSRLYARQQAESDAAQAACRRSQIGGAERSERIRTYRFHEKIVVDHRLTGYEKSFPLGAVLNGDLDGIIDALITRRQAEELLQQANV